MYNTFQELCTRCFELFVFWPILSILWKPIPLAYVKTQYTFTKTNYITTKPYTYCMGYSLLAGVARCRHNGILSPLVPCHAAFCSQHTWEWIGPLWKLRQLAKQAVVVKCQRSRKRGEVMDIRSLIDFKQNNSLQIVCKLYSLSVLSICIQYKNYPNIWHSVVFRCCQMPVNFNHILQNFVNQVIVSVPLKWSCMIADKCLT